VARVISDAEALDAIRGAWTDLFETSPNASPPLRWEWVREWWRVYGPVYGSPWGGLRVIAVTRGSRLVGALPLYEGRRGPGPFGAVRLGFVTTGAAEFEETCAEYLDLLHAPGEADACAEAVLRLLADPQALRWDELDLSDVPQGSPLLAVGDRLRCGGGVGYREYRDFCFTAVLRDGFEGYLKGLSAETRKEARKVLKEAGKAGVTLEIASDEGAVDRYFDELIALHRGRWQAVGKPGSFAPRHAEFHRGVARQLAPSGRVVLARLSHGGTPVAVINAHRVGGKLDIYQQGVNSQAGPVRSPGTSATLLLMAHMAERGVTEFDQLKTENSFKARYFKDRRGIGRVRLSKRNHRTLLTAADELARSAGVKALRLTRRLCSPRTSGPGRP
jgi:CelD/BcsL family acetyltransferase involved in cellulose biosynthesis